MIGPHFIRPPSNDNYRELSLWDAIKSVLRRLGDIRLRYQHDKWIRDCGDEYNEYLGEKDDR